MSPWRRTLPRRAAQATTVATPSAGPIIGSVTFHSVRSRDAPSVAAAASYRRSRFRKAPSTVRITSGVATKAFARMTPQIEYGSSRPVASCSGPPTTPRRPSANSSAAPPTTGGSTMGSVTSARTAERPGNGDRASTHASGTPTTAASTAAAIEDTTESTAASTTKRLDRWVQRSVHGARAMRPMSGRANSTTPTAASSATGHGGSSRAARRADRSPDSVCMVRSRRTRHGARNLWSSNASRAGADSRNSTKAVAAPGLSASASTAAW